MSLIDYCYGNNNKLRLIRIFIDIYEMNMSMRYKSNLYIFVENKYWTDPL